MKEYEPYTQSTVRDVIFYGERLEISEKTLSFREAINDELIIPWHNVLTKYIDLLKDFIIDYSFTDDNFLTYKYQPRKLSYDLYGTPDLAFSILYINNMVSVTEFTRKNIKVFTGDIVEVINELFEVLETDLKNNRMRFVEMEESANT